MIIWIDAEKVFDKIQNPLMIKLNKLEGMVLLITKSVRDNPIASILLGGEKLKFPQDQEHDQNVHLCYFCLP